MTDIRGPFKTSKQNSVNKLGIVCFYLHYHSLNIIKSNNEKLLVVRKISVRKQMYFVHTIIYLNSFIGVRSNRSRVIIITYCHSVKSFLILYYLLIILIKGHFTTVGVGPRIIKQGFPIFLLKRDLTFLLTNLLLPLHKSIWVIYSINRLRVSIRTKMYKIHYWWRTSPVFNLLSKKFRTTFTRL